MSNSLRAKISTEENLRKAWDKINKNDESHGLSGETIASFNDNLTNRLSSISKQLSQGKYRFSPNRAAVIPKDNGKYRPLQIPEIRDRIVLKAIALEFEEQFSELFKQSKGVSFAYQKSIGIKDALDKIVEIYTSGKKIILEADIINFFGTVNKDSLLRNKIFPNLPDDSLNKFIFEGLNQPVKGTENFSSDQAKLFDGINKGIPQGNPLSPLLSNIYLADFDQFMISNDYDLIRYADDFIVLCSNEENAMSCYTKTKEYLENELQLKIHPIESSDKTRIIDPLKDEFSFLSVAFDGKDLLPSQKNIKRFKNKIRSICNTHLDSKSVFSILEKIKYTHEGWISAYYYTKVENFHNEIDYFINRELLLALEKLGWKFTKKSKNKVPNKYRKWYGSAECLSNEQRKNSGIPLTMRLVEMKR